jgi:peptidyl-prolyl cis-trans isomerase D
MLQQMRRWSGYLKWLMLIPVTMFIVWAAASWTGGQAGPRRSAQEDWAAKVNGTVIDANTFHNYARRLDSTYQQIFGAQYQQQRAFMRVGQAAIEQLVEDELLVQAARAQGLDVSPQEIAEAITHDPSFQDNGHFIGLERYQSLFRGTGASMDAYEDAVRRRLVGDKYRHLLAAGITVSDEDVQRELQRRLEKTTVDWVSIDAAVVQAGRPSDSDLAAFYAAHGDRYRRGEGRTGGYVLVNPRDLLAGVTVAEADIRAAYDRDAQTRYTTPDQRHAAHILFKVPADATPEATAKIQTKAQDVLRQVRAGGDFAALAKKYSEDSTASAGGDLGFFGHGQMDKEFEQAAFSLPVGQTSDLVRTTYGFHIIKVLETRAASSTPYESVHDRIRDEMQIDRARSMATERAKNLATAAHASSLADAARSQGLTVTDTGPVRPGDALANLPGSQAAVTRLIGLATGQVSEALPIPEGQIVLQATGTLPDEARPLQEVRDKVEQDWLADHRASLLKEKVASLGLAGVAKAFKTELKHQDGLTRGAGLPGIAPTPELDRQITTLAPGAVGDPIVAGASLILISVKSRDERPDEVASQRDATRDNLLTQQRDRLLRAVVRQLRDSGDVTINATLIAAVDKS